MSGPFPDRAADRSNPAPVGKVAAAGIAGAVTTLLVWAVHQFAGVDLPAEVAAAITAVLAFAAGYLKG